jgi:apolipoprotein N-acyltransferase
MANIAASRGASFHLGDMLSWVGSRWACLAIGSLASVFAVGGRWDVALAAWIAPVFLLRVSRISRPSVAIPAMWLVSFGQALAWAFELSDEMTLPSYAIALSFGAVFALPYAADRLLTPRLDVIGKLMVFPAAWACTEFLMGSLSPLGVMYGLRANTQTENLPLLQLTSLLGPYSIGFLIAWLASTMNWIWENPRDGKAPRVAAAFGVCLGLVLLFGGLRYALTPPAKHYVRMATVTPSMYVQNAAHAMIAGREATPDGWAEPQKVMHADKALFGSKPELAHADATTTRAAYALIQDNLLQSTREAARSGAKVVVWSETAAPLFSPADTAALMAKVGEVARQEKIYVVAAIGQAFARNQAHLIGPGGREIWSYDKRHPVPLLEPVPPGHRPAPIVQTPFGRLTNVICFDADFPAQSRVDADIMMVPGFEFPQIGRSHTLKWVRVRAIENGYSLIRSAYDSQSAAFDRLGNVLATQDTTGPDRHIMYADVPTEGRRTLYNRFGDILVWLSLAGLMVATGAAFRQGRTARGKPRL